MLVRILGKGVVVELGRLWLVDLEERVLVVEIGVASQQQDLHFLYLQALHFGQGKHVSRVLLEELLVIPVHFLRVVRQLEVEMDL